MKRMKVLSLITVLALMLSVIALPVYAVDASGKISTELKAVMEKAGQDDKIKVTVWTVDIDHDLAAKNAEKLSGISGEEIEQMGKDSSLSKDEQNRIVDNYIKCLRESNKELITAIADEVFKKAEITEDEIELKGEYAPMHLLKIDVSKINKLAACDKVATIDLSEDLDSGTNAGGSFSETYYDIFDGGFFNGASAGKDIKVEDGNLVGETDGEFTVNIDNTGKSDVFKKYFGDKPGLLYIRGELIPKAGVAPTTSTDTYIQFGKNGTKKLISDVAYCSYGYEDLAEYAFPRVNKVGEYVILVDDTFDFDGNSFTLTNDNYSFKINRIYIINDIMSLPTNRTTTPEPDVKLTGVGQTASVLNDGDTTNLYTTIRNSGKDGFYEGSLEISFTVDGKVIDTVTYDKRIEVGESVTVKSSKKWSASFGAHTVKAVIKPSEKAFAKASSLKQRTNVTDN